MWPQINLEHFYKSRFWRIFDNFLKPFFRSSSVTHGLAKLKTVLYRNNMVPDRQGSAAHEIQKTLNHPNLDGTLTNRYLTKYK